MHTRRAGHAAEGLLALPVLGRATERSAQDLGGEQPQTAALAQVVRGGDVIAQSVLVVHRASRVVRIERNISKIRQIVKYAKQKTPIVRSVLFGGRRGTRTPDPLGVNEML